MSLKCRVWRVVIISPSHPTASSAELGDDHCAELEELERVGLGGALGLAPPRATDQGEVVLEAKLGITPDRKHQSTTNQQGNTMRVHSSCRRISSSKRMGHERGDPPPRP